MKKMIAVLFAVGCVSAWGEGIARVEVVSFPACVAEAFSTAGVVDEAKAVAAWRSGRGRRMYGFDLRLRNGARLQETRRVYYPAGYCLVDLKMEVDKEQKVIGCAVGFTRVDGEKLNVSFALSDLHDPNTQEKLDAGEFTPCGHVQVKDDVTVPRKEGESLVLGGHVLADGTSRVYVFMRQGAALPSKP